jgi:TetR/AcrR family transcriptional regulator, tetracycline repressor protein
MESARHPGQRAGLTRAAVLAAAHELVAEGGIEALSMRALADRLRVRPNALYSHVETKAALVDTLLDDVLAEVEAPGPGDGDGATDAADPVAGLRAIMTSTYRVLLAHADLVPLYISSQGARGTNAQRLGEVMLALLARAGIHGDRALDARRVLIIYTIGFAAFSPQPPLESAAATRLPPDEVAANFRTGLDWLLAGITASG